jgi:putative mRNA 3-end processing factor
MALIDVTECGLFCGKGGFYIDPWRGVERAIITHAHGDHARFGSADYLVPEDGAGILKVRLGSGVPVQTLPYGETLDVNGVAVSLHPAGHVLGSCMVRVEYRGEVWVISGDYKTAHDPTCRTMAPLRCNVFISESTFGLPVYRWQSSEAIFGQINRWWRNNCEEERCSIIFAYALGKSQRILAGLDPSIGPIGVHGAVGRFLPAYEAAGAPFPLIESIDTHNKDQVERFKRGGMILAPPSANATPWLAKFGDVASAAASGWMTIRGPRRRENVEQGFVLSDHADWPGLLGTIEATGAERVGITHGYVSSLVRYLREKGIEAFPVPTHFRGDKADEDEELEGD